jgi:hypothetical protein
MKHYMIITDIDGLTEVFTCWADDSDHALEQFDDASVEEFSQEYITHMFQYDTEILNSAVSNLNGVLA